MKIVTNQMAEVINENLRSEKHGETPVAAVDMTLKTTVDGNVFGYIVDEPSVADHFFTPSGQPRFPAINPIRVSRTIEGIKFAIYDKNDKTDRLVYMDCTVKDMSFELITGASALMTCKVQFKPVKNKGHGDRLMNILRNQVAVDMEVMQTTVFDDDKKGDAKKPDKQAAPKKKTAKKKTATKKSNTKKRRN